MTTTDNAVTAVVIERHKDVARRLDAVLNEAGDDRTEEAAAAKDVLTWLKELNLDPPDLETLFREFSAKVHQHAVREEPRLTRHL